MHSRCLLVLVGLLVCGPFAVGCSTPSSDDGRPVSVIDDAETGSDGTSVAARTGDCGEYPDFTIDAENVAAQADRTGIGAQSTPEAALRAALTHGSMPYFGGRGGAGVVAWGYPGEGWYRTSTTGDRATFRAPLHSGTAQLTFSRVGGRWLLSHGSKDC